MNIKIYEKMKEIIKETNGNGLNNNPNNKEIIYFPDVVSNSIGTQATINSNIRNINWDGEEHKFIKMKKIPYNINERTISLSIDYDEKNKFKHIILNLEPIKNNKFYFNSIPLNLWIMEKEDENKYEFIGLYLDTIQIDEHFPITKEFYKDIENLMLKAINKNSKFGLDDVITFFNSCEEPKIVNWVNNYNKQLALIKEKDNPKILLKNKSHKSH